MKPELFDEAMYHLERGEMYVDSEDVDDIKLSCFGLDCTNCKLYKTSSDINRSCNKSRIEIYNYITNTKLYPWLFL